MKTKDFTEERHQKIAEQISAQDRVNVEDLARFFKVTKTTIRRDLITLEERGLLYRAYGGAVKREQNSIWQMSALQARLSEHTDEKKRIAAYVAGLIHDGESIMIDGGSTTMVTAQALAGKKNLLIVTNALGIAETLNENGKNKVILTGGELLPETNALVGNAAEHDLSNYRAGTAIIGASGIIPGDGYFAAIPQEAEIKSLMLRSCRTKIIIADSSKIGQQAFYRFCTAAETTMLITDKNIAKNDIAVLKKANVNVVIV